MKYLKFILLVFLLVPINVRAQTKAVIDITNTNISDLTDALEKGYITSELLVTLYLERIEAYNSEFNAINTINPKALEEAKILDEKRQNGEILGPLHGIPIVVKTNIDVAGLPTTGGAKALSDNYPNEDAFVIQRLKEAGAIILASTNMSEFAFSAANSYSSYGSVKNAFNLDYTPYGSSGGSAVAVALSFAAASLGTDTNSSVRLPASAAGLVGMRPSLGLVSKRGVLPYDLKRDTVGVLSKTVDDNALILDIIAKYDALDEDSQNNASKNYFADFYTHKIKIAYITDFVDGSSSKSGINGLTNPLIKELFHEKIEMLSSLGFDVIAVDNLLSANYITIATQTKTGSSFCDGFNSYIQNTTSSIRSFSALSKATGKVYPLGDYLSSCQNAWTKNLTSIDAKKKSFEEHILKIMEDNDVDAIIYPTLKNLNLELNAEDAPNSPGSYIPSVIGYPALSVPMGKIAEFSYGLEILSTKNSEDLLYFIARNFEEKNNLELISSPLAPNLYTIPDYVKELQALYEDKYYQKEYEPLIKETRSYFGAYANMNEEEALNAGLSLISKYYNLIPPKPSFDLRLILYSLLIYFGVIAGYNILKIKKTLESY